MEEVAKAVGGGHCRLQMPLRLALAVRETVAGHRLGALEGAATRAHEKAVCGLSTRSPLTHACLSSKP